MDIFNGSAVLAKGGVREKYLPVSDSSLICKNPDPIAIVEHLKPGEIYIADLNMLQGKGSIDTNVEVIKEINSKAKTMLDFGISSLEDVKKVLSITDVVVIGTETGKLSTIVNAVLENPGRISISIDIKNRKVLKKGPEIPEEPLEIVKLLNELPLRDLIFLDLDRVGTASGFDPEFLKKLVEASRHNILLAGGVRDMEDLFTLDRLGIKGALIATSIHSGMIPQEILKSGLGKDPT
jgi:phosphoribosylformimino-5-aminoimidazole carboxamide ribotide isomerase